MRVLIKCCGWALLSCVATWCYADSEDGKDCEGCSDNGVLARYPGAVLLGADQKAFDEAVVPAGPSLKSDDDGATVAPKTLVVAGKRTRLFYFAPVQRSGLEVFANYREALEKAGMSVVWTCSNTECGPEFISQAMEIMHVHLTNTPESDLNFTLAETPRYLLASQARPQGNLHVAVFVADIPDKQRAGIDVIQVEDKPMDKGMAATQTNASAVVERKPAEKIDAGLEDAAALGKNLANTGQVNVYGIHFDFDKADIQPESKPQLDEIAKLLASDPMLKLRVTGHTDNVGSAEHNQTLSKRRADAIVAALAANYGVAAERLTSAGLGASLPVASNDSDKGRAMNRRVELIKQ
ncbi:MAG TPA: DUF4892 domain-containing protein [Rudaea sp.]|nr:DUF4892 domain-containing protein [Rudaea sp.]